MPIGKHNQASFIFGDTKFSVIYSVSDKRRVIHSERHTHSQFEVHMFDVGGGYMSACGKRIKFAKNTVVLTPPNTEHEVFSDDNDLPLVMGLTFSYKKAPSGASTNAKLYSYFSRLLPKEGEIAVLKDKFFGELMRKFREESESDPTLASVLIINMLESFFLQILRLLSDNKGERVPISSYKTTSITNDAVLIRNFEDYLSVPGCTLTYLSSKLNMCPRNTQKIFKRIFGMTFQEKMAEIRLSRAIKKIESTDMPLTDIAKEVGYNQYPTFRHAFIKKFGITPSEYSEKVRKQ